VISWSLQSFLSNSTCTTTPRGARATPVTWATKRTAPVGMYKFVNSVGAHSLKANGFSHKTVPSEIFNPGFDETCLFECNLRRYTFQRTFFKCNLRRYAPAAPPAARSTPTRCCGRRRKPRISCWCVSLSRFVHSRMDFDLNFSLVYGHSVFKLCFFCWRSRISIFPTPLSPYDSF
jgi:hypothetical protein